MKPAVDTLVFETVKAYSEWREKLRAEQPDAIVGFVPTMGALHQGHATLMRVARQECDYVVASIFVNPMQFAPHEDFDRYPRTFPADVEICKNVGVDAVFRPSVSEIYERPISDMTKVIPPKELIGHLCGFFRPGFFEGVATVVLKLFNIIQPTQAYFGEKDYQQLAVIKRMVKDLNLPLEIVGVPTVRERDGLAMSSRNVYLSSDERNVAPGIHAVISAVRDAVLSRTPVSTAISQAKVSLTAIEGLELQYLEVCDGDTLEPLEQARKPFVVLVAAKLGNVRLIDNVVEH